MARCGHLWAADVQTEVTREDRDHSCQFLSQASPSLIRILQVISFIRDRQGLSEKLLLKFYSLLDISWEELRTAICSLRPLNGDDGEELINEAAIVALDLSFYPGRLLWDLTCGSLRTILRVLRGEMNINAMWRLKQWGRYLRSCLPSPKLLQDLCNIEPIFKGPSIEEFLDFEFHNVVQWLKTFPQPPLESISRFEGYLKKRRRVGDLSDDLEANWTQWYEIHKRYTNQQDQEMNAGDDDRASRKPKPTRKEVLHAVSTLSKYLADVDEQYARQLELGLATLGRETQLASRSE
ncbi:hypothetical protein C8J57DRAFT_1258075 [Mycena rebaudengoi]|nr:hypothetical protein C8J57DRAFT_1258075 [Mycena rebaudengoi]